MEKNRPIIFFKPYTAILSELKESIAANHSNTDIYEAENLQEVVKLVCQLDHAIVLGAHPKFIAKLLQLTKGHLRRLGTKILLISPKLISQRTIDKFSKIGLTECFIEPVSLRTLEHKINLLLRTMNLRNLSGESNSAPKSSPPKEENSNAEEIAKKVNLFFDDDDFSDDILSLALNEPDKDISYLELEKQVKLHQKKETLKISRLALRDQNYISTKQTIAVNATEQKIPATYIYKTTTVDKIDNRMIGLISSGENIPKNENGKKNGEKPLSSHNKANTKEDQNVLKFTSKRQVIKDQVLSVAHVKPQVTSSVEITLPNKVSSPAITESPVENILKNESLIYQEDQLVQSIDDLMQEIEDAAQTDTKKAKIEVNNLELITAKSLIHCLNLYQSEHSSLAEVVEGIAKILKDQFVIDVQFCLIENNLHIRTLDPQCGHPLLFSDARKCPITPEYYEKSDDLGYATLYYPIVSEQELLAWAQCHSSKDIDSATIASIETILETAKGVIAQHRQSLKTSNKVVHLSTHKEGLLKRLLKKFRAA